MINEEEMPLAEKIRQSFSKNLGIEVPIEKIIESLNNPIRKGKTNKFCEIETEYKKFLIRISGKQWKPYSRESEGYALDVLMQNHIETNVLAHDKDFQICNYPEEEKSLEAHLLRGNNEDIKKVLTLIANEIAKYQKLPGSKIENPINDLINGALIKLSMIEELADVMKLFDQTCEKILKLLNIVERKFNHNDLSLKSIYVDLDTSKVTIVDWEYASIAFWSTDLSMLGRNLSNEQLNFLADEYYRASGLGSNITVFEKNILKFNIFILNFLYELGWVIDKENIKEHEAKIKNMSEEAIILNKLLDQYLHIQALTSGLPLPPGQVTSESSATSGQMVESTHNRVTQFLQSTIHVQAKRKRESEISPDDIHTRTVNKLHERTGVSEEKLSTFSREQLNNMLLFLNDPKDEITRLVIDGLSNNKINIEDIAVLNFSMQKNLKTAIISKGNISVDVVKQEIDKVKLSAQPLESSKPSEASLDDPTSLDPPSQNIFPKSGP